MGVAVGSSIQIALFVIPFMTILGWIMNKPLSLLFDPFESVVSAWICPVRHEGLDLSFRRHCAQTLFLSVLIVNYTIQDGRSNWRTYWSSRCAPFAEVLTTCSRQQSRASCS